MSTERRPWRPGVPGGGRVEEGCGEAGAPERSCLSLVVFTRCPHMLCLPCSHFQAVGTDVKEDALELMMRGGYLLFPAEVGVIERLICGSSVMI